MMLMWGFILATRESDSVPKAIPKRALDLRANGAQT